MLAGHDEIVFRLRESLDVTLMVTQLTRHPIMSEASELDRNALVTVASELGTNIVKYAGRGAISLSRRTENQQSIIEVFAEDHGPGIADVELALQDHYSTGNSLGLGLPAVRRMMDSFHIDSAPGAGVRVRASKRLHGERRATRSSTRVGTLFESGGAVRPLPGRQLCGDAFYTRHDERGVLLGIIDGLGHGAPASEAAQAACAALDAVSDLGDLQAGLEGLHDRLRPTVGAVAGLCHVSFDTGTARYTGVGNTGCMRVVAERWTPISRDGVLGQRLPSLFEQTVRLVPGDLLALWTDGLATSGLPQFLSFNVDKDPAALAREALQQFGRPYDDAGLLLVRWRGA